MMHHERYPARRSRSGAAAIPAAGPAGSARWAGFAGLILLMLCAAAAPSLGGAAFGFRAGYSDVDGDVFRGSGKLDGVTFFGLQAAFPLAPQAAIVLAGEAKNDELSFDRAGVEDTFVQGTGEWSDLSLHASLRLNLIPIGISGLYGGVGGGVHFSKVEIDEGSVVVVPGALRRAGPGVGARGLGAHGGPGPARGRQGDPVDDFLRRAEDEQTDLSWHVLGGLSLGLPILPLSVFGEVRWEEIQGDFSRQGYLAYAGVNLELP